MELGAPCRAADDQGSQEVACKRAQGDRGKQREGPDMARQDRSLRAQAEVASEPVSLTVLTGRELS